MEVLHIQIYSYIYINFLNNTYLLEESFLKMNYYTGHHVVMQFLPMPHKFEAIIFLNLFPIEHFLFLFSTFYFCL